MATKKIKELPEQTSANDTDLFITEDATTTKRITLANLFNRIKAKLGVAAEKAVANNLTTTTDGSVLDARQGKTLNDTKAPNDHASTGTTYGQGSASEYGHVLASSAVPVVAGTATAGSDNGKYAREGHVHPLQTSVSGNAGTATKLAEVKSIDGVDFDGGANTGHYAVCSTAAATAAKAIMITGFSLLANMSKVVVKFTSGVSISDATLNVSGTGAKPIFYKGIAVPTNYIPAGTFVELIYDGTNWNVVGELSQEAIAKQPIIQTGTVTVTPSAANTPAYETVTFPEAFPGIPDVIPIPQSTVIGTSLLGVSVYSRTATGCRIYLTRVNTVATPITWTAIYKP